MSLNKAITHGKEHRKHYRGAKAVDCTCRNHGSCDYCKRNRLHKFRDKKPYMEDDMETHDYKIQDLEGIINVLTKRLASACHTGMCILRGDEYCLIDKESCSDVTPKDWEHFALKILANGGHQDGE